MKKLFVLLLVILAAGAWIGQLMVQDPGYVLIAFNQTTIETSLWVMLVIGVVGFLLAHWLLNILTNAMMPVQRLRNWRDQEGWRQLIKNGMQRDFSWDRQGAEYVKLYRELA